MAPGGRRLRWRTSSDLFDGATSSGGCSARAGPGRSTARWTGCWTARRHQAAAHGCAGRRLHRARLRAEARLAGALHHPGIAQVYDYGEAPRRRPGDSTGARRRTSSCSSSTALPLWHGPPGAAAGCRPHEVHGVVAQVADALARRPRGRDRAPRPQAGQHPDHARPAARCCVDFGIARSDDLEPLTLTGTSSAPSTTSARSRPGGRRPRRCPTSTRWAWWPTRR